MNQEDNSYHFVRTDSEDPDFLSMVHLLDLDLAERDGADHGFYAQFNTVVAIRHVIVAYDNKKPVGCGAIKRFGPGIMEVKRMYVLPEYRGKGIAGKILEELEQLGREMNSRHFVLETGKRQPEAIALYEKAGYRRIPNYGQYEGIENSCCFEKKLPVT